MRGGKERPGCKKPMLAVAHLLLRVVQQSDDGAPAKLRKVLSDRGEASLSTSGTVATIDIRTSPCGQEIRAYKRVPAGRIENIGRDVSALKTLAWSMTIWNERLGSCIGQLASDLEAEINMQSEYQRAATVARAVRDPFYAQIAVDAIQPVPSDSRHDVFAYVYVPGSTLHARHDANIVRRYVRAFFRLMHVDGIVLMDASASNAIVSDDGTRLTLIDAGASRVMTAGERSAARVLHCSEGNVEHLHRALGNVTRDVADAVAQFSRPFWDSSASFPDFRDAIERIGTLALLTQRVDPNVAPIARAVVVMARTVVQLGYTRIDVASDMVAIKDRYLSNCNDSDSHDQARHTVGEQR